MEPDLIYFGIGLGNLFNETNYCPLPRGMSGSLWGHRALIEFDFIPGSVYLFDNGEMEFAGNKEVLFPLVQKAINPMCFLSISWDQSAASLEEKRSQLEKDLLQLVSPVLESCLACPR